MPAMEGAAGTGTGSGRGPRVLGWLSCIAVAVAYVVGWAPIVYWTVTPGTLQSEDGNWLYGAAAGAAFFDFVAIVLGVAALIARRPHVPRPSAWPPGVAIFLAVIGFGGVLVLLFAGTLLLAPIPVH